MLTHGRGRPAWEPAIHRTSQGTGKTGRARSRTAGAGYAGYRRLVVAQPVLFVLYLVLALGGPRLPGYKAGEVFPFFDWSLFSSPKREAGLFSIRVLAVDRPEAPAAEWIGRVVVDPGRAGFRQDIRFQKSATRLAWAVRGGREEEAARYARSLAGFLTPLGVTEYDLVEVRFDPLVFLQDPEAYEVETITRLGVEATD